MTNPDELAGLPEELQPDVRLLDAHFDVWSGRAFRGEWQIIRAELLRLVRENAELRDLCACTYQAAACYGLPVRFLDALSNAMHNEQLHDVDIDKLLPVEPVDFVERAECAVAELAATQAKVDALMLEYCPDEMTPEQCDAWCKRQKVVLDGGDRER